jgi:transposase
MLIIGCDFHPSVQQMLAELNFELWIGDPAQIRAKQVRKQKNDRRDAENLLKLMLKDDFPPGLASTSAGADADPG